MHKKKLIYLASPYAHDEQVVMQARFLMATMAAGKLLKKEDVFVFSPIIHSHILTTYHDFPQTDFNFWRDYDFEILSRCDELWILKLSGWENSKGIAAEIEFAKQRNIPIKYAEVDDYLTI